MDVDMECNESPKVEHHSRKECRIVLEKIDFQSIDHRKIAEKKNNTKKRTPSILTPEQRERRNLLQQIRRRRARIDAEKPNKEFDSQNKTAKNLQSHETVDDERETPKDQLIDNVGYKDINKRRGRTLTPEQRERSNILRNIRRRNARLGIVTIPISRVMKEKQKRVHVELTPEQRERRNFLRNIRRQNARYQTETSSQHLPKNACVLPSDSSTVDTIKESTSKSKILTPEQRQRINFMQNLRRRNKQVRCAAISTPEQRERKNALARMRRQNTVLTNEQRDARNAKERLRKRRVPLTPEQRERYNAQLRVSALSEEQRERNNARRRYKSLTPEQLERTRAVKRRNKPTAERLELYRARQRISALTPEQREYRNAARRLRHQQSKFAEEQRRIKTSIGE